VVVQEEKYRGAGRRSCNMALLHSNLAITFCIVSSCTFVLVLEMFKIFIFGLWNLETCYGI